MQLCQAPMGCQQRRPLQLQQHAVKVSCFVHLQPASTEPPAFQLKGTKSTHALERTSACWRHCGKMH
jgi:hypothetical protein